MLDRRHSDLEILRAHRGALNGRLVRLQAERTRLRAAEDAETEALAAIGELGRAEVAAVREWASTAAPGPAPGIDAERRAALTRDLVAAQAGAEAARAAIGDVDQELAAVSREAAGLAEQIEHAAVVEVVDQFQAKWAEIREDAARLRSEIARALAITTTLRDRVDHLDVRGRPEDAQRIRRMLEPLYSGLSLDFNPTNGEVAGFVPAWAEHLADLLR